MRNIVPVLVSGVLTLMIVASVTADDGLTDEQRARVEARIEEVRAELGDRLATTADEVIAGHVRAVGGREALESIHTLTLRGRNIILSEEERPIERFLTRPDRLRQQSPGGDYYLLSDGEKLWGVSDSGKRELDPVWSKDLINRRIDNNFIDYKERGIEYEYLGLRGFWTEPTVMYHLRRTFPNGHVEELFFDVHSGRLRANDLPQLEGQSAFRVFYDYREVGGVLFPFMWMRIFGEKTPPHVFIVDEMKVNEQFDDSFFSTGQ